MLSCLGLEEADIGHPPVGPGSPAAPGSACQEGPRFREFSHTGKVEQGQGSSPATSDPRATGWGRGHRRRHSPEKNAAPAPEAWLRPPPPSATRGLPGTCCRVRLLRQHLLSLKDMHTSNEN